MRRHSVSGITKHNNKYAAKVGCARACLCAPHDPHTLPRFTRYTAISCCLLPQRNTARRERGVGGWADHTVATPDTEQCTRTHPFLSCAASLSEEVCVSVRVCLCALP